VAVQANDTTHPARFDLYIHEARSMEQSTPAHSLATPADARGALTIGAVYYRDNTLQPYSSYGPTNDGRQKPELLGPDGVSVAAYAPEAFFGTSAAAPHVAGAAALIWSAHPELDADGVRVSLLANTIRVQSEAGDDATGSGVLRLPAPPRNVTQAKPTPRATAPATVPASTGTQAGAVAAICFVGAGGLATVAVLAWRRRAIVRVSRLVTPSQASIACATCSAQVPADAQFCSQCGRPIDAAASRTCVQCGTHLRPGAAYCSNCGTAI